MPPPTFGPVPDHLWMKGPQYPKSAGDARFHLEQLQRQMWNAGPAGPRYGHGSWGYTVLRTVYTPESDALFTKVIDKIERCVYHSTHSERFPGFGPSCQERCITYAEQNDEISRRFYLDVIEDKANLEELDGPDHFMALYDYFRRWVVGVGESPDDADPFRKNPRLRHFLVIDAESLRSLSEIADEMPPLRCAADYQEKAASVRWGGQGWLWLLDATVMPKPELHEDRYRGWCRIGCRLLEHEWFEDLRKSEEDPYYVEREERPENSGVYYYTGL
ncbi:hypothetical protein CONLIGDRAFT_454278 [Coniochaeta ligniaria NRRL 30616]|uniref:Uncharacterized protein n=1 Tax=Coniochaeta ligniaria NRRL 30616 TaxID=1408157 RepID=A0A1J7JJS8_9PEZI|nr:hypothetical protein CONLIGDRAFT_454278 [Coniochaeta ligniaria NRRL 30616]